MNTSKPKIFSKKTLCVVMATMLSPATALAQAQVEEVVVTGIRSALASAIVEKRQATSLVEIIQAEDIGKLPDQNLAEVLENVTGIQIDREAGVGRGVQIRGTSANRVEINGVATLSPGSSRGGISFEDIPAALIGSVEVIKAPTAQTVEGSVGGTINLRTLRGLELPERIFSVNAQIENSDLADENSLRLSATFGDSWSTDVGDFGFVISGNVSEQEVASFDPRLDRDRVNLIGTNDSSESFDFLRVQFLNQDLNSFAYDTKNFTTSFEFAPNDDLKFYLDATVNQQERAQQSAVVQFSGTGNSGVIAATENTAFETINFGTIEGPNGPLVLGNAQVVTQGILNVGVDTNADGSPGQINTNLRTVSATGSRITDSQVFALGTEWRSGNLELNLEASYSDSDSANPNLSTRLDFINPRGPQPSEGVSIDNGVPVEFDATNRTLQFGIAQNLPETPTRAELLNPANYALSQVALADNESDNSDIVFKADAAYDVSDSMPILTSIKGGVRLNEISSVSRTRNQNFNYNNATRQFFRPRADLFSNVVVSGPDNFDSADGRRLAVRDYLIVNPTLAFNNPNLVFNAINDGLIQNNADQIAAGNITTPLDTLSAPSESLGAFFDITEETTALYLQGDFEFDIGFPVRGNIGVRSVNTDLTVLGNQNTLDENGVETIVSVVTERSYDFVLPRFNLTAEVTDNLVLRFGASQDINRPEFRDLTTSTIFGSSEGAAVRRGNPNIVPEEVTSFDLSAAYYFSDAGFVSAGIFHKDRTDLIVDLLEQPETIPDPDGGQPTRDLTDPCEGGGIFNPFAVRNVFAGSATGTGICVPFAQPINTQGDATQSGIELAFQYDLSEFEDSLGWASGFGFIGNYTYQESDSSIEEFISGDGDGNALNLLFGRDDTNQSTEPLDNDVVEERRVLPFLSKNAYNATVFYEKGNFSARARYTWRSSFVTEESVSFGLLRIVDDRAQLNLSTNYQINDNISVSLDGVNLLREDRTQWCVNENALLCSQGLSDRRIIAGINVKF